MHGKLWMRIYIYFVSTQYKNDEYSTRYSQHFGSYPNDNYEQFSIFNCDCCATPARNTHAHTHARTHTHTYGHSERYERTALAVLKCLDVSSSDLCWLANNDSVSDGSGNDNNNNNNKARETAILIFFSFLTFGGDEKMKWLTTLSVDEKVFKRGD